MNHPSPQETPLAPHLPPFAQALSSGTPLIADGAAGTMLMAAGLPGGKPPEIWNIENPQAIHALHTAYVEAGAQVILTNTFGANRLKLAHYGLEGRIAEINQAAARIARQAAAGRAYVAGDMGPTGQLMKPFGPLTYESAFEAYAEQSAALAEAGVDCLWIETMSDLTESRAAIEAAHQVCDLPVLCSFSFGKKGRTLMGVSAVQVMENLWPLGLAAIGANCGEGLDIVEQALAAMHAANPAAALIAKPNAGLPRFEHGQTVYDVSPADFGARVSTFSGHGGRLLGACCGSGPETIAALAAALHQAPQA